MMFKFLSLNTTIYILRPPLYVDVFLVNKEWLESLGLGAGELCFM